MRFGVALFVLTFVCGAAFAADPDEAAHKYFGDAELVNQNGEHVRFYSDLLKGHVVVINTFFTECSGACPLMSRSYAHIQETLGDRLGKDVFLISLSVDPAVDTPEKLAAYAKRFSAHRGWIFLTGSKENVGEVLKKLGASVEERNDHTNLFFIGNLRTGLWKKAFGLAPPDELMKVVQSVLDDRG